MSLLKIAIIDDDEEDRMLFYDAIKEISEDFKVTSFSSGEAFFKNIDDNSFQVPDYIFLDYNMPILNGKEVLIKIKSFKTFKNVAVAIYSTFLKKEEINTLEKLGADCCIIKPNSFSKLKNSIKECIVSSS